MGPWIGTPFPPTVCYSANLRRALREYTTLTTPVDLYASRVLDVQTSSFSGSIVRRGGQLCRYSSSGQLPLFNLPFFALRTVLLLRCRLRE